MAAEQKAAADTQTGTAAAQVPYDLTPEKTTQDMIFLLGMIFFIFYFILIRPQQKRLKIHQAMMKGLAKGNKVITSGGIIGTIVKLEGDDVAVVEIAQGVKVRVARSMISEVLDEKASAGESANDN